MSTNVTVTVSGDVGTGKSAIYGEIVLALQALGVGIIHADPRAWESECRMTHADWTTYLDMYQTNVTMVEKVERPNPGAQP